MSESPGVVLHVVRSVGEPSQGWVADLINGAHRYRPIVACERVVNPVIDAAHDVVPSLPPQLPLLPYRVQRRWEQLDIAPLNPWRRALHHLPKHDVVHAHFGPTGWRCVDAGVDRVITTFYGFDLGTLPRRRAWRRAYRSLFGRGAMFLLEGPTMRERLIELGAPETRTRLQPLIAEIGGVPDPPRVDEPVVLMAGRFVEKKGFSDGIRAFAAVAKRHPDARLLVIGDGPERATIERAVSDAGLGSRINVKGFLDRSAYRSAMEDASILLQPSRTAADGDTEGGAPTTLLDAQALGTLVVASRHADIPFSVSEEAAYLSEEGDLDDLVASLDRALADRDSWVRRAQLGFQHVRDQHSRQAVIDRLEQAYDDVQTGV